MKSRLVLSLALVLGIFLPAPSFAASGILLLADEGKPEWNALVTQLAASADKQRPTELAFWSATSAGVQTAVDRLIQRGVSESRHVPLFLAASPSDLNSKVRSSVPIPVTGLLNGDPVAAEIVLGRAQEISTNSASEVVVLVSHRSTAGDARWVPDLAAAAKQLNSTRAFAAVVAATVPGDGSEAPAEVVYNFDASWNGRSGWLAGGSSSSRFTAPTE